MVTQEQQAMAFFESFAFQATRPVTRSMSRHEEQRTPSAQNQRATLPGEDEPTGPDAVVHAQTTEMPNALLAENSPNRKGDEGTCCDRACAHPAQLAPSMSPASSVLAEFAFAPPPDRAGVDRIRAAETLLSPDVCLVFDTETTGLTGAVIQLGFVVHDYVRDVELASFCSIWKPPPGEYLHPQAVAVHKIDEKRIEAEGVDPTRQLEAFLSLCAHCLARSVPVVAHNARFDVGRIRYTSAAFELSPTFEVDDVFCTMRNSTPHCDARTKDGRRKAPRNAELHAHLFGTAPGEATLHDALADARVTTRCFVAGYRRGWW